MNPGFLEKTEYGGCNNVVVLMKKWGAADSKIGSSKHVFMAFGLV